MENNEPELPDSILEMNENILNAINRNCHTYKEINELIGYSISEIENAIKSYFIPTYAEIRLENGVDKVYPTEEAIHTYEKFQFQQAVESNEVAPPVDIPLNKIDLFQKRVLQLLVNTDENHPIKIEDYKTELKQGISFSSEEFSGAITILVVCQYIVGKRGNFYITFRGKAILQQINNSI